MRAAYPEKHTKRVRRSSAADLSVSKKSASAAFSAKTRFPCACGVAGETCKETLLRKASESTAHVAGFGIQLGGLRPSETPKRFFDNLGSVAILWRTFFACVR